MIRSAQKEDWESFLHLATSEGWRVPQLESRLFCGPWQKHAYALREGDPFCGLVTAVPHQKSGWIGNLIVPAGLRGRGYGQQLFAAAIDRLEAQGISSLWLTASRFGQPMYEKAGFVEVGEIERWVSETREAADDVPEEYTGHLAMLRAADEAAWGEQRSLLLDAILSQGQVLSCSGAVALLQREEGLQVLGPWYAGEADATSHRMLLKAAFADADPHTELVADVLQSSPVRQLLADSGFRCAGRNTLMVRGKVDGCNLNAMVSLASLGSLG